MHPITSTPYHYTISLTFVSSMALLPLTAFLFSYEHGDAFTELATMIECKDSEMVYITSYTPYNLNYNPSYSRTLIPFTLSFYVYLGTVPMTEV